MTIETAKKRIASLSQIIDEHNYNYYTQANATISDYEFDMLLEELILLENQFPELRLPHSPTQRVGGEIVKEFQTVTHKYPMLSLSNSYSKQDLIDFDERIKKTIHKPIEYVCELKYDGVAIGLTYRKGELIQALTRGDGVQGDNVTANIKTIGSIPLQLKGTDYPDEFEVRGEVFLPHTSFNTINNERAEIGDPLFANPRNAAAGSLKMQNSSLVAKRKLDCLLYLILGENLPYNTHFENLEKAKQWGFKISNYSQVCYTLQQVNAFIEHWATERHNLPFDIDGVVIKINAYEQQLQLGLTAKSPRWAIAYKYKAEQVATILKSITYQVGRTGAITPVANLQPVQLAGSIVKRATLHNAAIINKLDIRINDTVFVEKGGEIIPKIIGVDLSQRNLLTVPTIYITQCPECNTTLIKNEGEIAHYCPNELACPPQIKGKLEHFTSRKAMYINSMGAETIELLYNAGLIRTISSIYDLKKEQLLPLERIAEKSATVLLEGIEASKHISFERVLFAIGIRHVGQTTAKKLALYFKNIDTLMQATENQLLEVEEVGEKIAESIISYFANVESRLMIEKLKQHGLQFQLSEQQLLQSSNILENFSFVISGVFTKFSREDLKKIIEQNGGKNVSSISSKTNYVVAGENMGPSKLEKAQKLGIKIINEDELMQLIEHHNR